MAQRLVGRVVILAILRAAPTLLLPVKFATAFFTDTKQGGLRAGISARIFPFARALRT